MKTNFKVVNLYILWSVCALQLKNTQKNQYLSILMHFYFKEKHFIFLSKFVVLYIFLLLLRDLIVT